MNHYVDDAASFVSKLPADKFSSAYRVGIHKSSDTSSGLVSKAIANIASTPANQIFEPNADDKRNWNYFEYISSDPQKALNGDSFELYTKNLLNDSDANLKTKATFEVYDQQSAWLLNRGYDSVLRIRGVDLIPNDNLSNKQPLDLVKYYFDNQDKYPKAIDDIKKTTDCT